MRWLLFVLCATLLDLGTAPLPPTPICPRVCTCRETTATCGENYFGLTEIPSLPPNIEHFILLNGNIFLVNRKVLSPVSNCPLRSLTLLFDNVTQLSNDAFTDFPELRSLDLSRNTIPPEMLKEAFGSLGDRLENVVLVKMGISYLPRDLFGHLKASIINIDLSGNKLKHVFDNDSLLEGMPNLEKVNVSHNQITIFSDSNTNLKLLNLDNNRLERAPDFCLANGSVRYSSLEELYLTRNRISALTNASFSCLTNIKRLFLGHNDLDVIPNNTFSSMPNLNVLQLNHVYLTEIGELAFKSNSLLKLDLSNNRRLYKKTFSGNFPFKWAPKLLHLSLENTVLDMLLDSSLNEMFSQLKSVTKLNLEHTMIKTIPASLSHLHTLTSLNLGSNQLISWNDTALANLKRLNYINLNQNNIRLINETSFPFETRRSLKVIDLGNNYFVCTCALQWFRTWMTEVMNNKSIKFVKYPQSYWCQYPRGFRLDKFNPTYYQCQKHESHAYVLAGAVIGCFVFLVVVAVAVVYRCRWKIRLCLFSQSNYQRLPGKDVHFAYDAFVIYSGEDSDWVINEVANFLEKEERFKLCIHERDFLPGMSVADNVKNYLEKSKKVILVVSKEFANSNWCQFEAEMAVSMQKHVTVVIRERVSSRRMSTSLRNLMESPWKIQWENDQASFRSLLVQEMNTSR